MIKAKTYKIVDVRNKEDVFELITGVHDSLKGRECIIAQAKEGEVAWLFVHFPEDKDTNNEWHRVHTSEVQHISTMNSVVCTIPAIPVEDITIETLNTTYVLRREG